MIRFGSAEGVDPRSPAFRSAFGACRSSLPAGVGRPPSAAQLAQVQRRLLAVSRCMRAHALPVAEPARAAAATAALAAVASLLAGVVRFPDPVRGGGGARPAISGIDARSAMFRTARAACAPLAPPS